MRDVSRADYRAGARPVLDDHRLLEPLADALGRKAGDQVIGAARPEPDDKVDGVIRPLRARRRRSDRANKYGSGENDEPAFHYFLPGPGVSLLQSVASD